MLRVTFLFVVAAILATSSSADDKKTLIVTAVTHDSRMNERTSYHTTPEESKTACTGTATGDETTRINMDCNTTSTPAKTTSITTRITEVSEEVRGSDNMTYTIACTDRPNILAAAIVGAAAGGGASGDSTLAGGGKCKPLIDGAHFDAEIKGTTMWVHARKEGRKVIKIKYKILNISQYIPTQTPPANVGNDVRKQTPLPTASHDECRGDEQDTNEVWRLGRSLGEKDDEIADAIKQRGVCPALNYLRGDADGRAQHPQQPHQAQVVSTATVHITSSPTGGEIYIDGKFFGNTPSDITLTAGEHVFKVALGAKEWSRSVQVTPGEIRIHAEMTEP